MLIVVTVLCVWLGITAKRARDQRWAVEAIREVGGIVGYEHTGIRLGWPAVTINGKTMSRLGMQPAPVPGPEWLRKLIGDEYFFTVSGVNLYGSKANDATLAKVSRLTGKFPLNAEATGVTDAGLEHLQGLTNFNVLNLRATGVTDAGLERLHGLTNLIMLDLRNTRATEDGVKKLRQALPNCKIYYQIP